MSVFDLVRYQDKILSIRGLKVMLDRDVAEALGIETGNLNRNAGSSPKWDYLRDNAIEDQYRFQLTEHEFDEVKRRCSNRSALALSRSLPWVYSRRGCIHFGTSLDSEAACFLAVQLSELFNSYVEGTLSSRVTISDHREARLYASECMEIAKILGTPLSLARAITVQRVSRDMGIDVKDFLIENVADSQDRLVTPTELGISLELTAKKVNMLLASLSLQIKVRDFWELTELGRTYGVYLDTGKRYSDGTPVQQVKWYKDKTIKFINDSMESPE
jgi:hypothetical protein